MNMITLDFFDINISTSINLPVKEARWQVVLVLFFVYFFREGENFII